MDSLDLNPARRTLIKVAGKRKPFREMNYGC